MRVVDAANAMTPAYLAILSKGYEIRSNDGLMIAERESNYFSAEGPVSLLGLIAMAEIRGESWQASDDEIGEFLEKFG